jgi:hypothetical protein
MRVRSASRRRFDRRTFAWIAGATLLGALWAGYHLLLLNTTPSPDDRTLIWIVFATPFAAFWGWFVARPAERWQAALVCFAIYFFAFFIAARIERLLLGRDQAAATGHLLYFRLKWSLDLLGCLAAALQRARALGTIPEPAEPVERPASTQN